jgi:acetyl esterase/lipase
MVWLHVIAGALSTIISYVALRPAPTYLLWFVRIGVTEWGHWLAPLTLAPLLGERRLRWSGWLLGVAGLVAQAPRVQAWRIARTLPDQVTVAFASATPAALPSAPARPAPLVIADLLRGIPLPKITPERLQYAERDGQALTLDVYHPPFQTFSQHPDSDSRSPIPDPHRKAPLIIVIHGGAWESGDSTQLPALNRYLAARGYAVAAINYRLAPQHRFPKALDDLRAALDYLCSRADALGIDASRVVLLGRSAGAQLALLAAYTAPHSSIRGVVAFYGPTDLRWGYEHPSNPAVLDSCAVLERYLGGAPSDAPDRYYAASPIHYVDAQTPATLLIHGETDEMVSVIHSERLAAKLTQAERPHLFLRLPWAAHGCDANFSGPSGQLSLYAIERFLVAVCA